MIPAVQPMVKTSYTERGNEYKESNIGKYAAGASVAGVTAAYGGEKALNSVKNVYKRYAAKPKQKVVTVEFGEKGASIVYKSPLKARVDNFKAEAVKSYKSAMKLTKNFISKESKVIINFAKDTKAKITMKNIKDAGKAAFELVKKTPVKKCAGAASAIAGVAALGAGADVVANKISAKKADKA